MRGRLRFMPEVNFLPNPASPIETPAFFYSDSTIAGSGSPEGVVPAWPGTHYTDRDNGDTYIKQTGDGTLTGWAAESGGGGGGVTVVTSTPTDDPGSGPNIAYRQSTGEVWLWSGTSWDKIIG